MFTVAAVLCMATVGMVAPEKSRKSSYTPKEAATSNHQNEATIENRHNKAITKLATRNRRLRVEGLKKKITSLEEDLDQAVKDYGYAVNWLNGLRTELLYHRAFSLVLVTIMVAREVFL
jgi:hypothetical protein